MAWIDRFPQYEFHEEGFVISYVKSSPRVMKPIKMGQYVGLQLKRSDGHTEKAYLHRLICEAFYGPCPGGMECRHLDGDRGNNRASNLAWGSKMENENDRRIHKTTSKGEKNPMAKLSREKVNKMRQCRHQTGYSYKAIGDKFGVSAMTAFRAVTGQSWSEDD